MNEDNNHFSWVGPLIGLVVLILLLKSVFGFFNNIGKYEGQTAEEWYDEYDASETELQNLKDCVNDYMYYGYSDSYAELRDSLDNISSCDGLN